MNYKLLIVVSISFLLLTFSLGKWGLMETSEARYAEISREMIENDDYLHPKLLGIYHYHKPPLTYQITTLGYKIFGVNEFGARFFLQIAILIQMLLIYQITLLLFKSKEMALASALIYFSLPIVLISSRNLTTDVYLNTFILGAIYSWLSWKLGKHKILFLYLFYICLGISFEIKGPVSLIFPLVFILVYKLTFKDSFKITYNHIIGILLFLGIATAWYIFVFIENEKLWDYFIKEQLVNRIASKSYNRAKPFWFYLLTIPAIGLPWIFILIHYLKSVSKSINKSKSIEFILYLTITILIVVFSIFKTKLILYVLPLFGFVSIVSAKCIFSTSERTLKIYNKSIIGFIVFFLVGSIIISLINIEYHFDLLVTIIISLISLVVIVFVHKRKFTQKPIKTAYLGFILGCIILFSGTQFLIKNESLLNSPKKAIQFVNNDLKDTKNILVYNYLLASTEFYSDKNIITLNNGHNTVQREIQFETDENWQNNLIDIRTNEGDLTTKKLLDEKSVLLVRKRDQFKKYITHIEPSFKNKKEFGTWVVYY